MFVVVYVDSVRVVATVVARDPEVAPGAFLLLQLMLLFEVFLLIVFLGLDNLPSEFAAVVSVMTVLLQPHTDADELESYLLLLRLTLL